MGELALAVKTIQRVAVEKGLCSSEEFYQKLRQIDLEAKPIRVHPCPAPEIPFPPQRHREEVCHLPRAARLSYLEKMESKIRLVQFLLPERGRRVGLVKDDSVADLTGEYPDLQTTHQLFLRARANSRTLADFLADLQDEQFDMIPYASLLRGRPGSSAPHFLAPLDHPDPAHCTISGTGLTHLGSAGQRDGMHSQTDSSKKTDSQKMFEMGLAEGKPERGRGVQPEWFYKGSGLILRSHNDFLDIPAFALDGGEEPEIAGCYIIDEKGLPHRLGLAVGNEWSDHVMEKQNYLWLAPSKLRTCSLGPELVVNEPFKNLQGRVRIFRDQALIYESVDILTGEDHMSHSLLNLEDHHFKYSQFRHPGDVHLHFFGTSKMSYGAGPPLEAGDRVVVEFDGMGPALVNFVRETQSGSDPVRVRC